MDYYLSQAEIKNKKTPKDKLIKLGKIKRKDINKKQRDFRNGKDIDWIYPSKNNLELLPLNIVLMKLSFKLDKPYISKDDSEIYSTFKGKSGVLLENPITRDKLTGFPMVRPTSWKGHLRYSAEKINEEEFKNKKEIIKRLFGDSDTENHSHRKGYIYFYPSFFKREVREDVLTPLDRKNRTPVEGKSPINIEEIPKASKANFYLLYFPCLLNNEELIDEDLKFLGEALKLMFYTYGFSAKKSSGFGIIQAIREKDLEVYPEKFKNYFFTLYEPDKGGVKKV